MKITHHNKQRARWSLMARLPIDLRKRTFVAAHAREISINEFIVQSVREVVEKFEKTACPTCGRKLEGKIEEVGDERSQC